MIRTLKVFVAVFVLSIVGVCLAPYGHARPDQYMGDASIYAGVAQSVGRPNVLFIIDNSRSTLHEASNAKYNPARTYPRNPARAQNGSEICSEGEDNAGKKCYLPTVIYAQDQQGDFSQRVVDGGADVSLGSLCDGTPADPLTDPVRTILRNFGTYSGAGGAPYFNLARNTGACATGSNGEVYALGNYLNYLMDTEGDTTVVVTPQDPPAGETCTDPVPASVVSKSICTAWFSNGTCKNGKTSTVYYVCNGDHTSSVGDAYASNSRQLYQSVQLDPDGAGPQTYNPWGPALPLPPTGATVTPWQAGVAYKQARDRVCTGGGGPVVTSPVSAPQREVMYEALSDVIQYASTVVNFGAMVYGGNNSGGFLVSSMADLSESIIGRETQPDGTVTVQVPDCSVSGSLAYCQFLAAIPGMRTDPAATGPFTSCSDFNGADCVNSNTGRPQAEAVFDAGYYFGADYASITNGTRLTEADDAFNQCGLNHIILISNGFSNGDDSPKLDVIGDADGDNYPDENDYGLGSHWLDDVARSLKSNNGVTTHTVLAFQSGDDLMQNAALDGGGRYYVAANRRQLAAALLDLLGSIINEKSTSFVAPVVPASTTNRTISSNRVYLGLFRPQGTGPWFGNVKKYGLLSDNRLAEPPTTAGAINGDPATYPDGTFITDSVSFWSLQDGTIPSSIGNVDPNNANANARKGDGAEVAAGGIGGVLLRRVEALSTVIKSGTGSEGTLPRDIFTFLGSTKQSLLTTNNAITVDHLGLTAADAATTLEWWDSGATPDATDVSALTFEQAQILYRRNNLMRFVHGFDALSVTVGETIWDARKWIMGDVLHSRPVVFNYTKYTPAEENVCGPDGVHNSSILFVGANDGMMHAFRDCDGREVWSFVPEEILGNLKYLPGNKHTVFVDAPPSIFFYDKEEDGEVTPSDGDKVIMVFGLRRGGGQNALGTVGRGVYYALDITEIDAPQLIWKLDTADYPQMAETWGIPVIKPIKVLDSPDVRYVAFIGGGYDQNEDLRFGSTQAFPDGTALTTNLNQAPPGGSVDGLDTQNPPQTLVVTSPGTDADGFNMRGKGVAAVLVAYLTPSGEGEDRRYNLQYTPGENAAIGTVLWNFAPTSGAGSMTHAVASDIRTLDLNNNGGYIDTLYAGDLGGRLWRFDTSDRTPGSCAGADLSNCNWTGQIIFSSNPGYSNGTADNSNGRKIFYPPAVAKVGATTYVCFGTGDREHPLNLAVTDRLYCVKDFGQTTAHAINESDLVDVTDNIIQSGTKDEADIVLEQIRSSPTRLLDPGDPDSYRYGWYIRLNGTDRTVSGDRGEKELAEAVIFNNEVFFSTYQIKMGARASCEAGNLGISRLYRLDLETGKAVYNYDTTNDASAPNEYAQGAVEGEVLLRTDRVKTLGEGIPSGIVQVVDSAGNVSLLISSSDKVEGIGGANPTSTFPIYWIQR